MLGSVARYESEHRSDRIRREVRQRAESGKEHGGPRPYGWNRDGSLNPEESAIVAELTRRIIGGESGAALAAELRSRGVPSSRGAQWRNTAIRKIVLRSRNCGLREYRGEIVAEGLCPPIVDRDSWEAVRAVLLDPARTTRPGNPVAYLLSGLMTCGVCEGPVTSGGARHGYRTYECAARKHVRRKADDLDDHIQAALLVYLADIEKIPRRTSATGQSDVHAKVDALRVKIDKLEDKYADEDLSRAAYLRNRDRLGTELADLERSETLSRLPGPLVGVTVDSWWDLPLERKRAAIKALLKIEIMPTTKHRFDKTAIKITPAF